jgi:hypothetical protein
VRGLEPFRGRAQCASCHVIADDFALLTDQQFHAASLRRLPDRVNTNLSGLAHAVIAAKERERTAICLSDLIASDSMPR